MKILFDSSSLISISETCLSKCLGELQKKMNADFLISPSVYNEIVAKPLGIKRFSLSAVRLSELVEKNSLKLVQLDSETKKIIEKIDFLANNAFLLGKKPVKILHSGEIEALALLKKMNADALAIDERTTRLLIENPEELHSSMEKKYEKNIEMNKANVAEFQKMFSEINIIRSSELIALAFEMDALAGEVEKTKKGLEAALFAAKFSGCSVSFSEISDFVEKGGFKWK